MRVAPIFDNLHVGAGIGYVEPFDPTTGLGLGLRDLGELDEFSMTFDPTVLSRFSNRTRTRGLVGELPTRMSPTLRIVGVDWIEDVIRYALYADVSRVVQPATAITDEPVFATIIPGVDQLYKTKKLGPLASISLKFNAVTGVLGTDYVVVNPSIGLIKILGTTTKVGPVLISYTPTAYTSTTGPSLLTMGTRIIQKARFLWVGDPTQGPARVIDIPLVSVKPDGKHDLISDNFGQVALSAPVYEDTANNPSAPFGTDVWLGDVL